MTCGSYKRLNFGDGVRSQKVLYIGWNQVLNRPQEYTESEMNPEPDYYLGHANTSYKSAYRWPCVSFLYLDDSSAEMHDDLWGDPLLVGWG